MLFHMQELNLKKTLQTINELMEERYTMAYKQADAM